MIGGLAGGAQPGMCGGGAVNSPAASRPVGMVRAADGRWSRRRWKRLAMGSWMDRRRWTWRGDLKRFITYTARSADAPR